MSKLPISILAATLLAPGPIEAAPRHLVAFGDSTTAVRGKLNVYAKRLAKELPGVKLTNAGIGGNHTVLARKRFAKDVLNRKPDVVVIQFGINDAAFDVWKKPPAKTPRVPQAAYQDNLKHFIRGCRGIGATPILMSPNPLRWTEKLRKLYGKPPYEPDKTDGFNVVLRQYAETVRQVAREEGVAFIDIYAAFEKSGPDELLLDGMHPNEAGHELVTGLLLPVVRKILAAR